MFQELSIFSIIKLDCIIDTTHVIMLGLFRVVYLRYSNIKIKI